MLLRHPGSSVPIEDLEVLPYVVPTEEPESDGTLSWDHTGVVVARVRAGGEVGLGYAYGHVAAATVATTTLRSLVVGRDATAVGAAHQAMTAAVRNVGRGGVASTAISAVDTALWDLRARLLGVALSVLFDARHHAVPVYGSGGFTSSTTEALAEQLAAWAALGLESVKMKVGGDLRRDADRVAAARHAVGDDVALMVDANGAYSTTTAQRAAACFAEHGVSWFEEPVSSEDLDGLRQLRERLATMDVAAGEYGYDSWYFHRMVGARAVDVAQPDATRCGGYTGFREVAAVCRAAHTPISAHTAPQLHAHLCVALPEVRHVEWFHDHVRIERLFFDGCLEPIDGTLRPDRGRPGNGLTLRDVDVEPFAARTRA